MNRYTVTWFAVAENQLAEIWLHAVDREMVREAADRIEVELSVRPTECGILVHPRIREIAVPPLYALYTVRDDDRVVEVAGVYRIPPDGN